MKSWLILFLSLFLTQSIFAQALGFSIRGTYQEGIPKQELEKVATISDLNSGYPSSWISGYISVDVEVCPPNGQEILATGRDDRFTNEQIALINEADYDSDINVVVKYQPEGIEIKEVDFTYTVIPEQEAAYLGGEEALRAYVKENAIAKIPSDIHKQIELAILSFKIGKKGEILEPQIFQESSFPEIDKMLLQCLKKMPSWIPAKNAKGEYITQDFVLNVGYMAGC